uniref:Cyclic nucleotide-binding domain-containing protein n=2 Tax=Timema TaxID=61471 RepID=A0A7R8VC07_TIMDO|nr:unnamed protein product [Timema douglasi]
MYSFRFDWSWEVWFLFGTIASATHPHYVVTILQDLGTIGSCWVSYGFVHGIKPGCGSGAREGQLPVALMLVYSVTDDLAGPMSILEVGPSMRRCRLAISLFLLKYYLGGVAIGFCLGKVTALAFCYVFNDAITEVILTLVTTYATFFISEEFLGTSGVLAVAMIGIMVSAEKTSVNAEVERFLHDLWEILSYIANTLLFLGAGIIIVENAIGIIPPSDLVLVFITYIICNLTRSIAMLKMDKFLADANWVLVEEATKIKHPFKIEYENEDDDDEEEEDDMYMGYRFTTCPDCQKDVLTEPTAREFKEMTKEARARVLKAKKVSYWRQFEHGMLSKEGVRVLVTAVDVAADKEEQVVDLEVLKNNWKAKGYLVFVRSKLIDMMSSTGQTYYRVPRQRWRHGCYAIAMHRCFDAFIYFAIILNSIPIILEIQVNPPSGTSLNITLKVLNNIFFLIYLVEFVIKASIPKIIAFIDTRIDLQLSQGYDTGKGFVTGEEEIAKILVHIVDNKRILDEMKLKVESNRLTVTKELGLMQRDRPWIAITVKTRQAIRSILNNLRDSVLELKDGGLLDAVEYPKLIEVVEDRLKYLRTHIKMVEPCPPQILLKEVPWVVGDEAVAEFLLENAETTSFNYGDAIVSHGEIPDGIFIIVSGLVKLLYTPNEKTLENLQRYGALPNMDFFTNLRFDEKQEDYIVSGNVIGELGVLTGRPYDITMTCDSSVQAYKVSLEAIKDAMNLSSDVSQGLRARMWKAIAIRLAPVILMDVPTYQSWTQDKIKYHLERAFVPTLTQHRRFKVNELMEDLLLIEGQVKDYSNGMVYNAPTYIPRTVHQLMFPENNNMNNDLSVEVKLLIIPAKDVDELDIMENEENAMIISTSSSKCLQHLVQSRISSNASKLRKLRARNRKKNMFGFNAARPRYDAEGRRSIKPSMVSSSIFQTSNRVAPFESSSIFDSKEDSNKETVFTVKPDLGTSQDKREKEEFKRQRSDLFKVKENDNDDKENQEPPVRKPSIKEEPEVPTIPPRNNQKTHPNLKIEKMPVSRPYILPPRVKMDDLTEEEEDSDG